MCVSVCVFTSPREGALLSQPESLGVAMTGCSTPALTKQSAERLTQTRVWFGELLLDEP